MWIGVGKIHFYCAIKILSILSPSHCSLNSLQCVWHLVYEISLPLSVFASPKSQPTIQSLRLFLPFFSWWEITDISTFSSSCTSLGDSSGLALGSYLILYWPSYCIFLVDLCDVFSLDSELLKVRKCVRVIFVCLWTFIISHSTRFMKDSLSWMQLDFILT